MYSPSACKALSHRPWWVCFRRRGGPELGALGGTLSTDAGATRVSRSRDELEVLEKEGGGGSVGDFKEVELRNRPRGSDVELDMVTE